METEIALRESIEPFKEMVVNLDLTDLGKSLIPFKSRVDAIEIKNNQDLEIASGLLIELKKAKKDVTTALEGVKGYAKKLHSFTCDIENEHLDYVNPPTEVLNKKISVYQVAERKRIEEENRKAQEEADKKIAAEKAKLEKKIEKAEESGDINKIMSLEEKKESVVLDNAPVLQQSFTKVKSAAGTVGGGFDIQVNIRNPVLFLEEIMKIDSKIAIGFLTFKEGEIKKWIKVNKKTEFPGLIISESYRTSTRT